MAKNKISTTSVTALFPDEMYELMTEVAAEEDRTMSWILRRAVQEYLINHGYLELEGRELTDFCNTGNNTRKPNGYKDKEN